MTGAFWEDVLDEQTRALIARRPPRPLLGSRPAIVAIDLYELAYAGGSRPVIELQAEHPESCGAFAWSALPRQVALFEAARARGIPIIHVVFDPRIQADPKRVQPTTRGGRVPGAALYEIKRELAPIPGELVVYKKRAGAFFGTPLVAHLNEMQIDSLLMVGESTSGCVRASVVEGWSYGYPVVVVGDCTYDRHDLVHQVSLLDMHLKYATVVSLEAAAALFETARQAAVA
jgi:maleamate amidohydrolase